MIVREEAGVYSRAARAAPCFDACLLFCPSYRIAQSSKHVQLTAGTRVGLTARPGVIRARSMHDQE